MMITKTSFCVKVPAVATQHNHMMYCFDSYGKFNTVNSITDVKGLYNIYI